MRAMPSRSDVPALVRRYLTRALPSGEEMPGRVRVEQSGEMWRKPGGRALRFTAIEEFAIEHVAFSWEARFPILPFVSIRVVDRYGAGEGLLEARLLGLRVMRQHGQETAEGEAMRYLAEIPWVPHAMIANRELEWRGLDAQSVEVATGVGSARVAVRLEFDAAGDVVRAFSDARPHPEGKATVLRPWGGEFSAYAVIGGIRVPSRAEVHWEFPDGPFTYWRGTVTSLSLAP
jgi:hypothetical protein